jgi:hypothetical protein
MAVQSKQTGRGTQEGGNPPGWLPRKTTDAPEDNMVYSLMARGGRLLVNSRLAACRSSDLTRRLFRF